ncbi:MAG: hypothetical protein HQ592_11385, partial [Planctomycetes bacterium]|nr:hypothetical protein [Planctomycetota bacterium]
LDTHSTQARLEVDFNAETLTLTWQVEGEIPVCQSVDGIGPASKCGVPGPFDPDEWRQSITGKPGRQRFPIDSKPLE